MASFLLKINNKKQHSAITLSIIFIFLLIMKAVAVETVEKKSRSSLTLFEKCTHALNSVSLFRSIAGTSITHSISTLDLVHNSLKFIYKHSHSLFADVL